MKEYHRENPMFSLCGLNCGLCPRYCTEGASKCPGCGGTEFHLKHPTCAVITCNQKTENVQYCFQCSKYPCERYSRENNQDSFITYQNVKKDIEKAKEQGMEVYQKELDDKMKLLDVLLKEFDDGRHKSYYCTAVNLLDLETLEEAMKQVRNQLSEQPDVKVRMHAMVELLELAAKKKGITLALRKS